MTSENPQLMDFDDDSKESPEVHENDEHHMADDSEPAGAASSRKLETHVKQKETETENFNVSDEEDCDQNRSGDNSKESGGTSQIVPPDESATGARTNSAIEIDSQETDQPHQDGTTPNDSGDDTEEYRLGNENSAEMGTTASKKSKLPDQTSFKDKGSKTKQTLMGDYFPRDSSPCKPKAAKPSKESSPDQPEAARSSRHSSPDESKAGRSSSPDQPKAARPFRLKKRWSDLDTEAYRNGYPNKKDDPDAKENLKFYTNKLKSRPEGDFIDNIHKNWKGDYKLLESHHGYIQWLFPIREQGMNYLAQELQLHEAEAIKDQEKTKGRVLKSYELMLDFYGMRLKDKDTGEIERAENWKGRFAHLNRSKHNHLRITRILKSLGELGYERFQRPFVEFVLREALEEKTLKECIDSCSNYWIGTVKNDEERKELEKFLSEKADSHPSCTV